MTLPFGKYHDKEMWQVPSSYLSYIMRDWTNNDLLVDAELEYAYRTKHGTHWDGAAPTYDPRTAKNREVEKSKYVVLRDEVGVFLSHYIAVYDSKKKKLPERFGALVKLLKALDG